MKLKVAVLPMTALLLGPMAAHSVVIDFNALVNAAAVSTDLGTNYVEDGFRLTAGPWNLVAIQPLNGSYLGSVSVYHGSQSGSSLTTLTRVDGTAFSFNSIDMSRLDRFSSTTQVVTFTGNLSGGGTLSQNHTVNSFGLTTFSFSGWSNLTSVTWSAYPNWPQFDNIVVDSSSVPEPGTLALLGLGLLGLGVTRRKAA